MRFPQTFIDDLRRQADIVRVVNDYVTLKKKGTNWMACCPFHKEKSPSFSVSPSKDIFYCFGCSKGGSVFTFVMEMERVSFPEAVRIVAEKAGVPVPKMEGEGKFEARREEADAVVQLNAWALEWWEQQLQADNAEARAAREYLEGRQLAEETVRAFRLGYAPDSWDALSAHLKRKGATAAEIERSGLVVKKDAGGSYDRFRGRVIFPVLDAQGRAVAFGARAIRAGDEPKYLNSPETPAYTKGRHLFGLSLTRDEIRLKKFAILVEGYLDLIVPYQFGVKNVVASLGTALTPEQARLLARFARRVVVNYDGDRAGVQAAKRAIETLLAEDFEVKALALPNGADPDEFLRAHGAEEYNRRRGEALPHIQFVLAQVLREHNILNPSEKGEAVKEVLPFLQSVRNPIQMREYFDISMNALRVEDPSLRSELWKTVRAKSGTALVTPEEIKKTGALALTQQPSLAERRLLELIVHDSELRGMILPQMEEADYAELPSSAIFRALRELDRRGEAIDFTTIIQTVGDDPGAVELASLILIGERARAEGEAIDDVLAQAESYVFRLRMMRLERHIKEVEVAVAEAQRAGDNERLGQLTMESVDLKRRRNALLRQMPGAPDTYFYTN